MRAVKRQVLFRIIQGLIGGLILTGLVSPTLPGAAQANPELAVRAIRVEYVFGSQFTVVGQLDEEILPDEVVVFWQEANDDYTQQGGAELLEDGSLRYRAELNEFQLRPFVEVRYWLRASFADGQVQTSEEFRFFYEDNRFDWQTLENGPLRIHWYAGDLEFAQTLLNTAQAGLRRAQELLPTELPEDVLFQVFAYASTQELQSTLQLSGRTWVAGHADPDLGIVMVSLPPGPEQRLEMERQVPHELMHLLIYQNSGTGTRNLPTWLNEGLASMTELYPNPDYALLLEAAQRSDDLMPIRSLCKGFPSSAAEALLAYAQSTSFTRYIYQKYGEPGIQRLLDEYAKGVDCEQGVASALTISLTDLEQKWLLATFEIDPLENLTDNLAPWVFYFFLVLGSLALAYWAAFRKPARAQR